MRTFGSLRRLGAKLRAGALAFRRDEEGAVAIMTAATLVGAVIILGGAVDVYRFEMLRKKAQNTLDRGVLAAAALNQEVEPEAMVRSYMKSAGLELPQDTKFHITKEKGYRSIKVDTSFDLPLTFLRLAKQDEWTVPISSTAEERERNIEVSLVLDVSGSMRFAVSGKSQRRIDALRPAAADFIRTIMTGDEAKERTSVSIVPYAGQVNMGRAMFDHLGIERKHGFSSCVHFGKDDFTFGMPDFDDLDQVGHFTKWNYHDKPFKHDEKGKKWEVDERGWFADPKGKGPLIGEPWWCPDDPHAYVTAPYDLLSWNDASLSYDGKGLLTNTTGADVHLKYKDERHNSTKWQDVDFRLPAKHSLVVQEGGPGGDLFDHVTTCAVVDSADDRICDLKKKANNEPKTWGDAFDLRDIGVDFDATSITYLSNNEKELVGAIEGMHLYDGTGTANALRWGLLLLDPAFQPTFSSALTNGVVHDNYKADGSRPDDFAERPAAFNEPNTYKYVVLMTDGRITDQFEIDDGNTAAYHDLSSVKRYSNGGKSYTSSNVTKQFESMCEEAKENNVIVFTIGFDLGGSANSSTRATLQDCASSRSHYFNVEDGDIDAAFDAIAASIQKVRLTS